jgi:hypothetical protein
VEKHELAFVTSTCTMSCNVLLQDCTRHIPLVVLVAHSDEVDPFQCGGKYKFAPNTLVFQVFF